MPTHCSSIAYVLKKKFERQLKNSPDRNQTIATRQQYISQTNVATKGRAFTCKCTRKKVPYKDLCSKFPSSFQVMKGPMLFTLDIRMLC